MLLLVVDLFMVLPLVVPLLVVPLLEAPLLLGVMVVDPLLLGVIVVDPLLLGDMVVFALFMLLLLVFVLGSPPGHAALIIPKAKTAERAKVFFICIKFSCLLQRLIIFATVLTQSCSLN